MLRSFEKLNFEDKAKQLALIYEMLINLVTICIFVGCIGYFLLEHGILFTFSRYVHICTSLAVVTELKLGFVDNADVYGFSGEMSERLDSITLCSGDITKTRDWLLQQRYEMSIH